MDQMLGRIEDFSPRLGLKPQLQINVTLISRYDSAIDLLNVNSRAQVFFKEKGQPVSSIPTNYIGDALIEWRSRTVSPGDGNSITLLLPVDFDLLGGIEDVRQGHDVEIQLWTTFNGIERQPQGTIGQRVVAGEVLDSRYNSQGILGTIAKSRWTELLNEWRYSSEKRRAAEELGKTIREAKEAKRQAEEAATAAKNAAHLTAVTSLAEAYSDDAKVLGSRSLIWAAITLGIAAVGAVAMIFYVRQSMTDKFTLAEAVIRA